MAASAFEIGNDEDALKSYRDALECQPTPRQIASMYVQARKIVELLERPATAKALDNLFRPESAAL